MRAIADSRVGRDYTSCKGSGGWLDFGGNQSGQEGTGEYPDSSVLLDTVHRVGLDGVHRVGPIFGVHG